MKTFSSCRRRISFFYSIYFSFVTYSTRLLSLLVFYRELDGLFFISFLTSHELWIRRSFELIRIRIPYASLLGGYVCIYILYLKYLHFVCQVPDQSIHFIHIFFLGVSTWLEVPQSSLAFFFSA
jgi:hypothetical protein